MEHGAPAEAIDRPRASFKRMIDALPSNADRILNATAPSYARAVSRVLGDAIEIVPSSDAINAINGAYGDYLDQTRQVQARTSRTPAAIELSARLLDLGHGVLAQRISDARERTRRGVTRALNGLQFITFISIGIAALAVGLTGER